MPEISRAEQQQMLLVLAQQLQARWPQTPLQRFETPLSEVLVAGNQAWKFHKVVDTGFADFSHLAQRQADSAAEWTLNCRFAPALYLGLCPVSGTHQAPRLDDNGPLIDCAVHMQAFDQQQLWSTLARQGGLGPAEVDALADTLCTLYRSAPVAAADGPWGQPDALYQMVDENLQALGQLLPEAPGPQQLRTWVAQHQARWRALLDQRLRQGRVREGHGDLHLHNIAQVDGQALPFDALAFNPALRWADVLLDLAFPVMDLHHHGLPSLAHRLQNRVLEGLGDAAGAPVLRLGLVHRAAVRARVAALAADTSGALTYLDQAQWHSQPAPPCLLVNHGPSGSGKTVLTEALVDRLGVVRLRSDVLRKQLAGLAPTDRSGTTPGSTLYAEGATTATYTRLLSDAAAVLRAGFPALLDASFLQRRWRDAARHLADALGLPCLFLDFNADPATLRQRVADRNQRGQDASDATVQVLARQLQQAEPLAPDEQPGVLAVQPMAPGPNGVPQADWRALWAWQAARHAGAITWAPSAGLAPTFPPGAFP